MKRTSISFSHKYSKLSRNEYHTVRWIDFDAIVGDYYDIYLVAQNPFHTKYGKGRMRCVKIELVRLKDLTEEFCQDDADCSKSDFIKLMEGWYSKKPNWKGEDSEVIIISLKGDKQ